MSTGLSQAYDALEAYDPQGDLVFLMVMFLTTVFTLGLVWEGLKINEDKVKAVLANNNDNRSLTAPTHIFEFMVKWGLVEVVFDCLFVLINNLFIIDWKENELVDRDLISPGADLFLGIIAKQCAMMGFCLLSFYMCEFMFIYWRKPNPNGKNWFSVFFSFCSHPLFLSLLHVERVGTSVCEVKSLQKVPDATYGTHPQFKGRITYSTPFSPKTTNEQTNTQK